MAAPRIRPPRETMARMGDLAVLPVFLKLAGKTVLVAGGSAGTAWKAELLAAAGARVRLVWAEPDAEARLLAADWPERVTLVERSLVDGDFADAAVAIGALEDDAEAADFAAAARARGIPVNVVDKPAFCDFQFGAIVNRSPLVIGISTDGGAPTLGQAVRSLIETLLPAGFAGWARAAKAWRPRVSDAGLDGSQRKSFWRSFAAMAMARPHEPPCPVEREALIAGIEQAGPVSRSGHLALVGAGPGDPELLTLKAVRLLREADVILHDDLVGEGILAFSRREARKIHVGKRRGVASCHQGDICDLAVLLASEGNRVVRLKGGDPLIFGRADEEIAAARAAGVPLTVVNGVSAAMGAAASMATSLTLRGVARRLQFITAHDERGLLPDSLDWSAIVDPDASTCIYMGRSNLGDAMAHAVAAGLSPSTPARFVINATRPEEVVILATAATIAAEVAACRKAGPGVLLLGRAFAADQPFAMPDLPMALAAQ
jgi:uroporphyrin-III C-methyltransferase/precorrin-2 dehydrogenase/sirohydrochlorin ferrochelatase